MSSRARLKRGIAGGFFLLLLMGILIGGLATLFNEPEAHAASPGGVPVRIYFNPNFPAPVGEPCEICVELDAGHFEDLDVLLAWPDKMNPSKVLGVNAELAVYPPHVTVLEDKRGGCRSITLAYPGWVAVVASANGTSVGGVLEIQP